MWFFYVVYNASPREFLCNVANLMDDKIKVSRPISYMLINCSIRSKSVFIPFLSL